MFSFSYQVRLFYPFFSFKLHTFMHKFVIFFKNFEFKDFGDFVDFGCFNVKLLMGFLYACCSHDSSALIWRNSWFVKNFKIRVHVFLRKLGILFNWVKLAKIDHCYWWLIVYNMCYTSCDDQLLNLCVFEKLGFLFFKNWGFFIKLGFLGQFLRIMRKLNFLMH